MYERLGQRRPHPRQHDLCPQHPHCRHRLDQVLGGLRVERRHPCDIHQRDRRIRLHDALQQALHELFGAFAVQCTDQRRRNDPVPHLHYRRGDLENLLRLPGDRLLGLLTRGDVDDRC